MPKGHQPKLNDEDRCNIVAMARQRGEDDWTYTYLEIAQKFNITRCYVSILCSLARVPPRRATRRKGEFNVPEEFRPLYRELIRKRASRDEAIRLVKEHIAAKSHETRSTM